MKISNLKINRKAAALCLSSSLLFASLTGCNKQVVDFNKSFNVVIEPNGETISIVGISSYSDYQGTQVQYRTQDGLIVLSSTLQTQMAKFTQEEDLETYLEALANDEKAIMYYDELQNTAINYDQESWNKKWLDFQMVFNKAIILTDDTATILDIDTWKDYEDDDKIQIRLTDPEQTCIFTEASKIKLINDLNATSDSTKNYAISLVGSEEKVTYYNAAKTLIK